MTCITGEMPKGHGGPRPQDGEGLDPGSSTGG